MQLTNLSEAELIASAGGDPWAINQSLQAGSPFQISQLAQAFHTAGRCTAEADHAFEDARKRFDAAWNHQNGDHPINDSDEVQRVTKSLGAQSLQLPKIGADLEGIAASLAEAQKAGAQEIAELERELRGLDNITGAINHDLTLDLSASERSELESLKKAVHADAVDDVRDALKQMNSIRNGYSETLRKSMDSLHTEGYDPPTTVDTWMESPLKPGEVRDLGPVAGTGGVPGIPGIGAADLGEVVEIPGQPGKYLAIFGDSFSGNKMGDGEHYRSVAVPVTFDAEGHPHFGAPLTGPEGSGHELFPIPSDAKGVTDTLPSGTITLGDKTYMMVTGTKDDLKPVASWLVEVNGDPGKGWTMVPGSFRGAGDAPTQVSGYKGSDGKVYIAADSFDRSRGITMYRADPSQVTQRQTWQPWNGTGWGPAGEVATTPVSRTPFGELSFREVDGKAVLSGFNQGTGNVEVRVAADPTKVLSVGPVVVAQQSNPGGPNFLPQNYGGFILPGSTLDNLNLFVSQWNTTTNTPYNTREFQVNANR
ncbi:DUF4185 domain-containing protein [Mycobacterium avium]|uniref:putative alpha/beta hydrolase n=1 Tax=Mycobacterium avium TaxID=1764 RepID=UPI0008F522B3|nr:DUF4185 domain-containing protein [Mycobacterium avium]APA74087.1 DUF4185 domain-containing protein [Mycobacterium avium subsp. hominissuis]QNR35413.1 hypothetical protein BJP76_01335 [Mycobacterium avium subsp. hominissuis]